MEGQRVQQAIDDSIREDRIVTLRATVDTQEWVDLVTELGSRSDDWVDAGHGLREYWGSDDDGDLWRVHVLSPAAEVEP